MLSQKLWNPVKESLTEGNEIIIVGGKAVVGEAVEEELGEYAPVDRVWGNSLYDTAIEIANKYYPRATEVGLATADNFKDALVGGVYANARNIPLLLTSITYKFETTYKHIYTSKKINKVIIFGGNAVVSDDATGLTAAGAKKSGFLEVGKNRYYAKESGDLHKNKLFTVDGKTYGAAATTGILAKNKFQKHGSDTYYFGNDNAAVKEGIVASGGKYYYVENYKRADNTCKSYSQGGTTWNVIKGVATKVVTAKDKTLNKALKMVSRLTNATMTMAQKLRACWNEIQPYKYGNEFNPRIPHYKGMDWPVIYANDIFDKGGGNCLSYGAAFAFLAKAIGYDNVYACHSGGHGWAEINGLVYDPEWSRWNKDSTYYGIVSSPSQNYRAAIAAGYAWMRIKI